MVFINVRHTVADYDKWRAAFDADEARRRAAGGKGINQIYRDVDDLNTITIVMDWDTAENALKFLDDPKLREVMQAAGVVGMPAVRTILLRV